MSKTQAQDKTQPAPPPSAPEASPPPPTLPGFAGRLSEFQNEAEFLRSFFSRPTSIMDEYGHNVYPYGDDRAILPTQRDIRQLGLVATEPKERFPAVSWMDGAANDAQDYLRGLIAQARGGTAFTNYEIRLALRRLGGPGVVFTQPFFDAARGDTADAGTALKGLIDALWAQEDSLCRQMTRPIPPPVTPSEV